MDELGLPSHELARRRATAVLNIVLAFTGALAVAALVLEYGFRGAPPVSRFWLHVVEVAVVAIFVADRFARLLLARDRPGYLRDNWTDFALILVAAGVLLVARGMRVEVLSAGALYIIVTQAYILAALLIRGVNVNLRFAGSGIHPARLLVGSFLFMSLAGSGLLMLPAAVRPADYANWYYLDSLFTATSATCVTGLVVRDTGVHFTPFGQAVILALIQLGGLGIMMFGTVLAMMVGKGLSVRGSTALGEMMSTEGIGRIGRVVRFVILATVAFEAAGAVLMFPMFLQARGADGQVLTSVQAAWHSAFHGISAFCNAGFALYGQNMMAGVDGGWPGPLRDQWQMLGVMAPLIVLGGLGFPVLQDAWRYVRDTIARLRRVRPGRDVVAPIRQHRPRLALHSKIVLVTTAVLLVIGAAFVWAIEAPNTEGASVGRHSSFRDDVACDNDWRRMSVGVKARHSLFLSVTARTAGFNTVRMDDLSDASKLIVCGLMVIGGGPASTAGGMKTVTLAVLVLTCWCMLRHRGEVEAFGRSITGEVLRKVVALAVLYLGLLMAVVMGLCAFMRGYNFIDLLFEACSACGTVGLSTGITGHLTQPAKYVVIAGMFAGRIGPLTLLFALTTRLRRVEYSYPSEGVIIG